MEKPKEQQRDQWASKIGLVLAMAGNAVGLGNFLRFPMQAARNGGGAFMIPYLIAFVLLGLPLMFVEWGMGRYGGSKGHATMPGILSLIKNNKFYRVLGTFGIWIPLIIVSYYCFIESWTLAYSLYSLMGKFNAGTDQNTVKSFFDNYVAVKSVWPYIFFLVTITINSFILYKGISHGIEKVAKVLMPLLFIFAIVLAIRVFTLGTPNPDFPDQNVMKGLGFIWNPDFTKLNRFDIWLAAAGQIFFTLSLGMGSIACYASYVKKDDDVVASGVCTALTNETTEVVLGGSIAIPLAVAFFGVTGAKIIASESGFGLAFISMPMMFAKIPCGFLFGFLWFALLFFAGITSSIAMGQVIVAFLQEIVGITRKKAILATIGTIFILSHIAIFLKGGLDEMDIISCNIGLSIFALIEVIVWVHIFGIDRSWKELMQGSRINLWKGIKYITAFVSPVFLIIIIGGWLAQSGKNWFLMKAVEDPCEVTHRWITRGAMLILFVALAWLSTFNMNKTQIDHREERP